MTSNPVGILSRDPSTIEHEDLQRFEDLGLLKNGKPRLACARSYFLDLRELDIAGLMDFYKEWRDFDEFLVLHHRSEYGKRDPAKTIAVKCSKRGNDIYASRTKKRLDFLKVYDKDECLNFFTPKDFDCEKVVHTRLLWVTLTWDSNFSSLTDSWRLGQYYYNLWITRLRHYYGKIDVLRFPQAFPNSNGSAFGYQHFHLVLLFKEHKFKVFPYMNDKGEFSYRIEDKDDFAEHGGWHSWVDVRAINSMSGVYNYAVRHYVNAGLGDSDEAVLNNSMCWIFKKKSYVVSGGFRVSYCDWIDTLRNSKRVLVQSDLFGGRLPLNWILVGVKSVVDLQSEYPNLDFCSRWRVELPFCAWDPPIYRKKLYVGGV